MIIIGNKPFKFSRPLLLIIIGNKPFGFSRPLFSKMEITGLLTIVIKYINSDIDKLPKNHNKMDFLLQYLKMSQECISMLNDCPSTTFGDLYKYETAKLEIVEKDLQIINTQLSLQYKNYYEANFINRVTCTRDIDYVLREQISIEIKKTIIVERELSDTKDSIRRKIAWIDEFVLQKFSRDKSVQIEEESVLTKEEKVLQTKKELDKKLFLIKQKIIKLENTVLISMQSQVKVVDGEVILFNKSLFDNATLYRVQMKQVHYLEQGNRLRDKWSATAYSSILPHLLEHIHILTFLYNHLIIYTSK